MKKSLLVLLSIIVLLSSFAINGAASSTAYIASGTCGKYMNWTLDTEGTFIIGGNSDMSAFSGPYPWTDYNDSIKKIILQDGVTGINSSAFLNCTNLLSVEISNTVEYIGARAFYNCEKLSSVTIPDSVISIDSHAFESCDALSSVVIGNSVELIDYRAFYNCTNLKSVTLGNSVSTIDLYAFEKCSSLTSITIPKSVELIDNYAFCDCTSLSEITIEGDSTTLELGVFENTAFYNNKNNWKNGVLYIGSYLIEANMDSVPNDYTVLEGTCNIAKSAFSGCYDLNSVSIPDSVVSIGEDAFYDCEKLSSVSIPSSVTSIGVRAFGYYYNSDTDEVSKVDSFYIKGYKGSTAETYATENGFRFIPEDETKFPNSKYYMDDSNQTMPNIVAGTTVGVLINEIADFGIMSYITDINGKQLSGQKLVGTGCIVKTYSGNKYTVIVKGDVNGSGEVDAADYLNVKGALLGKATLTDEFALAADIDENGELSSTDYLKIKGFFLGTFDLYA